MSCELMNFRSQKLIENQNTINELMVKVQELQNEINCMNDSKEFKDAESVRSGQLSHVPSKLALFPLPLTQEDCSAAPEIRSLKLGMRMFFRETFLPILLHTLAHLVLE